jgi:Bacterial Ig domain
MSISARRATRLFTVAALAVAGLALSAQAASASFGRIQVAKINQGGNPSDTFAFHPTFTWGPGTQMTIPVPSYADASLAGGQTSQNYDVACNTNTALWACDRDYSNVTLQVAELAKPGYKLTDITCRSVQSTDVNNAFNNGAPTTSSPVKPASEASINLAAGTVNLKVSYNEWVVCWFTNTWTGAPATPGSPPSGTPAPSPQIEVSPARVTPGSAKLTGPKGCPDTNAVAATVSGKKISKVTFYVDNRKVKTLTKPNKGGKWALTVNMRQIAYGSHRVTAKVEFTKSSGTKTKTLRLSFNRCNASNVRPQFTG